MYRRLLLIISILILTPSVNAQSASSDHSFNNELIEKLINSPSTLIKEHVQESFIFYGLASYYNHVEYYIVDRNTMFRLNNQDLVELNQAQWIAISGRTNVLLIKAPTLSVSFNDSQLLINNPDVLFQQDSIIRLVKKNMLHSIAPSLDQVRYAHLWSPLATLSKSVEISLITIQKHLTSNWSIVIVIFSVLLRLLLLPIAIFTARAQHRISQIKMVLEPKLAKIKADYDGEEAHIRLMATYQELNVSPFFTLKPMLGSVIQIPILIAVFNALVEMPQFAGQTFLWIDNLSYPDNIGQLSYNIPMFGNTISLLPFLMTIVTLLSTLIFKHHHATVMEVKRQKCKLYLMALVFFILFYPFPAVVVFFWTLANIFQIIEQQFIKV